MPLPWKKSKSKSGRISRFVSDLQQSPKHGGSLVVETGFPTSLIDLFVKNRDRLKKSSSKRNKNNNNNKTQTQTAPNYSHPTRPRLPSPPPPSLPLQRRRSFPQKLDPASVTDDLPANKIEESFVDVGGLTAENRNGGDNHDGGNHGGGGCVLMVVAIKVFVVAVLALSTKKLAVGVTLSAFSLLFLEIALARVFTLLNLCPDAQVRLSSLIRKLIGKNRKEKREESLSTHERQNKASFEIIDTFQESRDCIEEVRVPEPEKKSNGEDSSTLDQEKPVAMLTIRDVVFTKEKSKSAKLKSKIVKKIVPKKLRSYKKKKKMKKEAEGVEVIELVEEEEDESVTELSSLYSEDRIESEISERDEIGSNPPLLESCEEDESGSKGDPTKAMALIVIALAGLLGGKVLAIGLTLSSCLILRFVCCRSQTSL